MQALQDIIAEVAKIKEEAPRWPNPIDPVPDERDGDKVAQFVTELWTDAGDFVKSYFQETRHLRRRKPDSTDARKMAYTPETWRKSAEALAYGEDWGEFGWGHREEDWMKEQTDGEIPRNVTVRLDHITANYHEFSIRPNISRVNELFAEERKKMGWKDWIESYVQEALVQGHATNEITMDYNIHPDGQVKNILRIDVRRTPGATSFALADGCHYVIFGEVVTAQQIEADFPDVDITKLSTVEQTREIIPVDARINRRYEHTKFYQKYRAYIDDPRWETVPFGPEEEAGLIQENINLLDGAEIKAKKEQNHVAHLTSKIEAVENLLTMETRMLPDEILLQSIPALGAYLKNMLEHLEFLQDEKEGIRGKRPAYPNGRYVCVIGDRTVRDVPNPYSVPWRKLVREVTNRKVAGRIDGAGDPEAMYNEAWQSDIQRSRIDELTLAGLPKKFRSIEDKADARINVQDDNDPLATSYFKGTPPLLVKGAEPPTAMLELYKISKANSQRDTGVNTISIGQEQPSGTSGTQVALVQRQNRIIITGALDRNLREALEDIIEGDLAVMRMMYKRSRLYVINGQFEDINVSRLLSVMQVQGEDGQASEVEVPNIEVTVKPGSNYPDEWEVKLNLLSGTASQITDPAQKQAIEEAILDHLGLEFPDFAPGGKYRRIAEATQIGLQVIQKMQEEEGQQQQTQKAGMRTIDKFKARLDKEVQSLMFERKGNGKTARQAVKA